MHNKLELEADALQQQNDHADVHSCLLRTGRGYSRHMINKTGRVKIGKMLPSLMNLNFCRNTQIVGSEIGINSMNL